ncbi:MAG: ATP-binding protein [Fusobacteriaceae bacterium]|nr:ATP-binding protein [Fusobacteriaceae bacterium]
MIPRAASKQIEKLQDNFRVTAVTGPRQAGKTTLLKNSFPDRKYVNLEDLRVYDVIKADPMQFSNQNTRVIVDEVQRIPELLSAIQVAADDRNIAGDFILSGSQNLLLSEKICQSLAGRAAYQVLLPFSLRELAEVRLLPENVYEQIWRGFYPALYTGHMDPGLYYGQYIATYVERDLRSVKNIHDLGLFRRFLGLLAGRIGQLINYESLANDTGISVKTAIGWLSILEASYLIYRLPPWHSNIGKRLTKSAKIYFTDTGLACYLLGISSWEAVQTHYLVGGLFENLCVLEVVKQLVNHGHYRNNLYFYRENSTTEIDLLVDFGTKGLLPVEIKAGSRFHADYLKNFTKFLKAYIGKKEIRILPGQIFYTGENGIVSDISLVNWKNIEM